MIGDFGGYSQKIIVLEGLDGTGKSALAKELSGILGERSVIKHFSSYQKSGETTEKTFETFNQYLTREIPADKHEYIILDRSWLSGEATRYARKKDEVKKWPSDIYKPTHIFILTLPEKTRVEYVKNRIDDKPLTSEEIRLMNDQEYRENYEMALRLGTRNLKTYTIVRELDGSSLSIQEMAKKIQFLLSCNRDLLDPRKLTTSNKEELKPIYHSWVQRLATKTFEGESFFRILPKDIALNFDDSFIEKHKCHFENIGKIFDYNAFFKPRHNPVSLGFLSDQASFDRPFPDGTLQAQDMPISFPAVSKEAYEYRIPESYANLREFVQKAADVWSQLEANAHEYYGYLSVSHGTIPPWTCQRRPSIHCDGFQSARVSPKERGEYAFVASNALSTVYYVEPFDVSKLDPSKDDYFVEYSKTTTSDPADCQKPYEVMMMDPYTLHAAITNTTDHPITRTFIRIIYSTRKYDRIGNTHNYAFDYKWEMVRREAQLDLLNKKIN